MINFFLQKDILSLKNYTRGSFSKILIIVAFFVVILGFSFITFVGTYKFFEFLQSYTIVGFLVSRVILAYSFLIIFILMIPSYLFSSLMTSFYDKSINFIIVSPTPIKKIYRAIYIKSFFIGLWPILIIGIPILTAYAIAFNLNLISIINSMFGLTMLAIISYGVAYILNILLQVSGLIKRRWFWVLFAILLVIILPNFIKLLVPQKLYMLYETPDLNILSNQIEHLPVLNQLLPSTWVTNISTQIMPQASTIILFILAILVGLISYLIGEVTFLRNWLSAQENNFISGKSDNKSIKSLKLFYNYGSSVSLITRFFTAYTRDSKQVASTMFLFILTIIAVLLLQNISIFRNADSKYYRYLISFSFMTINFIITILCLKFIFPITQYNLRDHLVLSSPISGKEMFKSFIIYSVVFSVIFSIALNLPLVFSIQGVYSDYRYLIIFIGILSGIILAMISLLIGTVASNSSKQYDESDITTSPQGIMATILSVIIIMFIGTKLSSVLSYIWATPNVDNLNIVSEIMPIIGFVVITGLLCWYLGLKTLRKRASI